MNKHLIIPIFTGALLGFSTLSYAQTQKMRKEAVNGQASLVTFEQDKAAKITTPVTDVFKRVLKLDDNASYRSLSKESSANGLSDEKYQLYYKNLKVEFSTYAAHFKNGSLTSINGDYYPITELNTQPSINEKAALANALKTVNSKKFAWQVSSFLERSYTEPKGELVVLPFSNMKNDAKQRLAYKFDVFSIDPFYRADIYVDAHTGEVVFTNQISRGEPVQKTSGVAENSQSSASVNKTSVSGTDNVSAINTVAAGTPNADTRYSGKRYIEASQQADGKYILLDKTRGDGVHTKSAGFKGNTNTGDIPPEAISEITDNDNVWTKEELGADKTGNLHATDVQWASGLVYDFFKETFNRNSLDNNGMKLNSYIHFGKNLDNAAWSGQYMVYGDGSALFNPLTSLDITAHELGHGVTEHTARLVYSHQSGALNESISDMWGAIIEHKYAPEKKTWDIGEEVAMITTAVRSLQNPKSMRQPDTYKGIYWVETDGCEVNAVNDQCGVHTNSGVTNHWLYILSQGKSGSNDVGTTYNVAGIGIDKATQLVYRVLTQYLTPNSTFMEMRDYTLQVAIDLYGEKSPEYIETMNAFNAVNLGGKFETQSPSSTNIKALNVTTHSVKLSWDAATDNQGIKEYRIYQNGTFVKAVDSKTLSYRIIELSADTPYKYQVGVVDVANNETKSNELDLRTLTLPQIDTNKPAPTTVTAVYDQSNGKIKVSWTASKDDIETVGYELYVNNEKVGFYRDIYKYTVDATMKKLYSIYVVAVDEDGNRSEKSNQVDVVVCPTLSLYVYTQFLEIKFADLSYTSPGAATDPYLNTKNIVATVEKGKTYTVNIKRNPIAAVLKEYKMTYAVWIDYDANGLLDAATETAYFTLNNLSEYSFDLKIPDNVKTTDKPVTIRFGSINNSSLAGDYTDPNKHNIPCGETTFGFYQDFGLTIKDALSTTETNTKEKISIYPNPVHDKLYIQKAKADTNYQIFSIGGERVKQGTYKEGIDVSALKTGVYVIKTNVNGTENTQKFIKK